MRVVELTRAEAFRRLRPGPHPFAYGGEPLVDRRGRIHPTCIDCGMPQNARGRHARTRAAAKPAEPRARAPRPVAVPREIAQLAYALDAVLALPSDVAGWRLLVRAQETRAAIAGVPELASAKPDAEPEPEPEPGPTTRAAAPAVDVPPVELAPRLVDTVEPSAVARARQLTRGVRDERARELAVRAVVAGWHLRRRGGGGHWLLECGDKRIALQQSYGDRRSWLNLRAAARRHGLDVEGL